jgi:2'-deoxynucleoside 5'-phosphate N-hydrolase
MRVYLAAAMTHPGRDLAAITALLECLEADGHEVPTRHVADPRGREVEGPLTDAQLARRDLDWVAGCDALVAEVSTPSHGVGVEVAAALASGKPALLAYRRGTRVSRLLLGLHGIEALAYGSLDEAREGVRRFLARLRSTLAAGPIVR